LIFQRQTEQRGERHHRAAGLGADFRLSCQTGSEAGLGGSCFLAHPEPLTTRIVVNVLACNTDAHAKNYAIIIRGNGASIAPMYDLMCGEVWENVTKNLAQKIAGKSRGDHLNGRHWQQFARECGLNPRQVLDRVGTLPKSALAEAEAAASEVAAMPAGTHEVLDQTREAVERRARILLAQLQELGDDPVKAVNKEETAVAKEECSHLR
jgi:serine/threonine-protein kinase HipA